MTTGLGPLWAEVQPEKIERIQEELYDEARAVSAPAFAQQTTPATRKDNQQQRIANGVQSGQLTAGETKRLETREAGINAETHTDRAANGGKLTTQERRQVNRRQNRVSRQIYRQKHNARVR